MPTCGPNRADVGQTCFATPQILSGGPSCRGCDRASAFFDDLSARSSARCGRASFRHTWRSHGPSSGFDSPARTSGVFDRAPLSTPTALLERSGTRAVQHPRMQAEFGPNGPSPVKRIGFAQHMGGRHRSPSGQLYPNLGQLRPHSTTLAWTRPNLGGVGPNSSDFCRILPESGRSRVNFAKLWDSFVPIGDFARHRPNLLEFRPMWGRNRTNLNKSCLASTNIGRPKPDFD